jgi:hypothetical protein
VDGDKVFAVNADEPGKLAVRGLVARGDHVIFTVLGEETVMMDVELGSYFVLDETAAFVWGLLDRPRTLAEVVAEIRDAYDVSEAECERDVLALLDRLRLKGLVHWT